MSITNNTAKGIAHWLGALQDGGGWVLPPPCLGAWRQALFGETLERDQPQWSRLRALFAELAHLRGDRLADGKLADGFCSPLGDDSVAALSDGFRFQRRAAEAAAWALLRHPEQLNPGDGLGRFGAEAAGGLDGVWPVLATPRQVRADLRRLPCLAAQRGGRDVAGGPIGLAVMAGSASKRPRYGQGFTLPQRVGSLAIRLGAVNAEGYPAKQASAARIGQGRVKVGAFFGQPSGLAGVRRHWPQASADDVGQILGQPNQAWARDGRRLSDVAAMAAMDGQGSSGKGALLAAQMGQGGIKVWTAFDHGGEAALSVRGQSGPTEGRRPTDSLSTMALPDGLAWVAGWPKRVVRSGFAVPVMVQRPRRPVAVLPTSSGLGQDWPVADAADRGDVMPIGADARSGLFADSRQGISRLPNLDWFNGVARPARFGFTDIGPPWAEGRQAWPWVSPSRHHPLSTASRDAIAGGLSGQAGAMRPSGRYDGWAGMAPPSLSPLRRTASVAEYGWTMARQGEALGDGHEISPATVGQKTMGIGRFGYGPVQDPHPVLSQGVDELKPKAWAGWTAMTGGRRIVFGEQEDYAPAWQGRLPSEQAMLARRVQGDAALLVKPVGHGRTRRPLLPAGQSALPDTVTGQGRALGQRAIADGLKLLAVRRAAKPARWQAVLPEALRREEGGGKIPGQMPGQAANAKAEVRTVAVQHAPLALTLTLLNPSGMPLTEQLVSAQFGAPRPTWA